MLFLNLNLVEWALVVQSLLYNVMPRRSVFCSGRESARVRGPSLWEKLPGQVCKIPNRLSLALPAGKNGCLVIRFSHDGK